MANVIEVKHEEVDAGFTRTNMYGVEVSEGFFDRTGRGETFDYDKTVIHDNYDAAMDYAKSTGKTVREI